MSEIDGVINAIDNSVEDGNTIEIVTRERVRGGWGSWEHSHVSIEQVGQLIRAKYGLTAQQIFKQTKIGDRILISFFGNLTQIAACYKAAGEDIYQAYCKGGVYKNIPIR